MKTCENHHEANNEGMTEKINWMTSNFDKNPCAVFVFDFFKRILIMVISIITLCQVDSKLLIPFHPMLSNKNE